MQRCFVLLILFFNLMGCANQLVKTPSPILVKVPIIHYLSVPSELTKPCPIRKPISHTVMEVVQVAIARRQALMNCNIQLQAIRQLGNKNN